MIVPRVRRHGSMGEKLNPKCGVLIADDQISVRSALRLILEENGIYAAGEVSSCRDLIDWLAENQVCLVLLDWELPGQSCKQLISVIRSQYPGLSIIVLDSRPQTESEALSAGADRFVSKGDPPEHLLAAINKCNPNDSVK